MSVYSNVTEQDLIILRKLPEQQKNQRALRFKSRILKQTHDIQLAQSLSPITKKLEKVKEYTKKLGDVLNDSRSGKKIRTQSLLKLIQKMMIFNLI